MENFGVWCVCNRKFYFCHFSYTTHAFTHSLFPILLSKPIYNNREERVFLINFHMDKSDDASNFFNWLTHFIWMTDDAIEWKFSFVIANNLFWNALNMNERKSTTIQMRLDESEMNKKKKENHSKLLSSFLLAFFVHCCTDVRQIWAPNATTSTSYSSIQMHLMNAIEREKQKEIKTMNIHSIFEWMEKLLTRYEKEEKKKANDWSFENWFAGCDLYEKCASRKSNENSIQQ